MASAARPLLVLALEYPLAYGGGVSVLARSLLTELRGEFRFGLVSPDAAADLQATGWAEQLQHHLPWPVERGSAARARVLAEQVAAWQPELVHFHGGGLYAWGNRRSGTSPLPHLQRRGVACLNTIHSVVSLLHHALPDSVPRWAQWAAAPLLWLGRVQALAATEVEVAVSDHDLRLLQKWYPPFRRKLRRIYHSRLPAELPAIPMAEARLPLILHAGHRAVRKGQHVLVEAFTRIASRYPEWRLLLAGPRGKPAYEARLVEMVAKHGLQERVEISPNRDDIATLMQTAAIYVQPSLEEALGLGLQEALFHGAACVGSRVGGIPELIEHEGNGLLAPPQDPAALASALDRLLGEPALRARLSAAAGPSVIARGMTAARMAEEHRGLYGEVRARARR